jgi:hypothetical protein
MTSFEPSVVEIVENNPNVSFMLRDARGDLRKDRADFDQTGMLARSAAARTSNRQPRY